MRYFVGLLVVLVTVSANPHVVEPSAAGGVPVVVARYNLLRTGVAADVGAISTPAVRWTFQTNGTVATSPLAADIDGDGKLDLLAGSMDHSVYALRGTDGAVLWQVAGLEHYVRNSLPIADFDGDGRLEITVQTEAAVVHTYDALTGREKWSIDLGDIVASTPAVGDLDGDGRPEIVYSMVVQGGVVALHGNGTLMWRNVAHDFSYRGPTLVDVNGDGRPDVV